MSWFSKTFGSVGGGLVGGLIGYGLAPFTGGASLALTTGLGAAAGTKLGGGSTEQALLAGGLGYLGGGYFGGAEGAAGAGAGLTGYDAAMADLAASDAAYTGAGLTGYDAAMADLAYSTSQTAGLGGVPVETAVGIPGVSSTAATGSSLGTGDLFDYARRKVGQMGLGNMFAAGAGLYGLGLANQMRGMAQDPNAPYRPGYAAELSALASNPNQIQMLPGYRAGLQAVQRAQAAQGFQGSGNMMAALAKYGAGAYNDRLAQLERLSGITAGPNAYLQGNAMANLGTLSSLGLLAGAFRG